MDKQDSLQLLKRINKSPDIPNLVSQQIIDRIISGDLKPGDKLPSEHGMTEMFGISRISLREAMKLLEAKGYIESRGRKGKFVKSSTANALETTIEGIISVDHGKIWELLEVRRILDSEAAFLAAKNATNSQVANLFSFREEVERFGIENILNTDEGGKLYAKFYKDLAISTNNTIYDNLMKSISSLLKEALPYSRQQLVKVEDAAHSIFEQQIKILDAIKGKNAQKAKQEVIKHLDWLESALKKVLLK
jgi:DNA-binding FadR family transcriptional regulator